jgi:hypothetical protein
MKEDHSVSTRFGRRILLFSFCALVAGCGSDSVSGPATDATAQIEIRYDANVPAAVAKAFHAALTKWSAAISKDLGEFPLESAAGDCFVGEPALNENHRNLLLFVTVGQIDGLHGALAYTDICELSGHDTLPIVSHIRLDRADVDSMVEHGFLQGVVMHEMGHALGFNPKSYLPKGLGSGGNGDPVFIGAAARAEFARHGAWYSGSTVPLEDRAGTGPNDPHWRFSVFGDELMVTAVSTGFKSPLSSITLGYFEDIGYHVNYAAADSYEVVAPFGGDRRVPETGLGADLHSIIPPRFVAPLAR